MRITKPDFKNNPNLRKGIWVAVIAMAIIVVGLVFSLLYATVANSITDLSTESMKEITQHDKQAITQSIETQWNTLSSLGERFRHKAIDDPKKMVTELTAESIVDTIDFGFIDAQGRIYNNGSLTGKTDEAIKSLCDEAKKSDNTGRFVNVYSNPETTPDNKGEVIVFGVQTRPFPVGNITIEFVFCRMETGKLDNKLKIDSYDGKGYSCIFNNEGNYVIRYNRSGDVGTRYNFYNDLKGYKLEKGKDEDGVEKRIDENYIREHIGSGKVFTIEARVDGEERLLRFSPMEDMNFYFVLTVSRSVFESQSRQITVTILIYFIIMAVVSILAIILLFYSRSSAKEAKLEKQHKTELSAALMKAEDANIAKTTFLNNMSHDIRTPMNAIIGFTDLAIKHVDDVPQTLQYLTKISSSSKHLLSLINDVLDMSRIESGKTKWELEPEDIESVVNNIVSMVSGNAAERGLTFGTQIEVRNKNVLCDKLRLTQVMLNILSNAIKYTMKGGSVKLSFIEKPCEREGFATFEACVTDTGIGMSKEYLKVLFDPFTRENNSTVSGIQGTGLGMAITKNLVDMVGGKIHVESEQGKGTEFTVTFEFELCEKQEEEKSQAEEFTFSGERVLLAEDNELNMEIAVEILTEAGLTVECAENGRQAVDMLVEKGADYYSLILMDVQMPVMDGYAATHEIRELDDPALADIPIIAMTANTFKEDVQAALDAGMNGHIGKPIDMAALFETISKTVKR